MQNYNNFKFRKGFTLLEVMIVVAIIMIIAFLSIPAFSRLRSAALLDQAHADSLSALSEARSLTLSSKGGTNYGVHFETTKVVRFTGTTYATTSASNVAYQFDPRVRIRQISLSAAGPDLYFKRLTGEASKTGTVVLEVVADSSRRATTTISASGIIE